MSEEQSKGSRIANWYSGKNIFITGATGYMGKVLMEKLLRSCPDLGKIYILIRAKRGQEPAERLPSIFNIPLFDVLRKIAPDFTSKIIPLTGDVTLPELGLSADDKADLYANIAVIFHAAATIKFDEILKASVAMNVMGTQELIKLAYNMTKLQAWVHVPLLALQAFVHVSTAYCNCNVKEIEEKIYPPPMDLDKLIQCLECLDEDILNEITPKILRDRPNTYTYTKAVAEQLLLKQKGKLPLAIFRPSIVTCSSREPMPGWIDNINGPTGFFIAVQKGVVRSLISKENCIADIIPVDLAINLMICVAWDIANLQFNSLPVYNCTSGMLNPITWKEMQQFGLKYGEEYPHSSMLWYPGIVISSPFCHKIRNFLFHTIPAFCVDSMLVVFGKKPFMMKIQLKIDKAMNSLVYFSTNEWKFHTKNIPRLLENLTVVDKDIFNFDVRNIDWADYIKNYVLGIRQYMLKESLDTVPNARQHYKRLKYLHYGVQIMFLVIFWVLFVQNTGLAELLYTFLSGLIFNL